MPQDCCIPRKAYLLVAHSKSKKPLSLLFVSDLDCVSDDILTAAGRDNPHLIANDTKLSITSCSNACVSNTDIKHCSCTIPVKGVKVKAIRKSTKLILTISLFVVESVIKSLSTSHNRPSAAPLIAVSRCRVHCICKSSMEGSGLLRRFIRGHCRFVSGINYGIR